MQKLLYHRLRLYLTILFVLFFSLSRSRHEEEKRLRTMESKTLYHYNGEKTAALLREPLELLRFICFNSFHKTR